MKMGDSRSRNVSQARSSVNGATGNRPAGTQAGSSGGRPGPKRISRKQREMRRKRQQLMAVSLILVLLIVILIAVLIKSCGNTKPQTDNVTTPAVSHPETQNEQGNASQSDGENNNQDNGQNNSGNSVQEKEYTGEDGKLHKVIGTTEKGYTIEEVDGVTYVDGVLIANKTYPLPEDFIPTNPEVPVTEGRSTKSLDKDLMTAWRQLQADAAAKKLNLYISSGYRSFQVQKTLYNNYVAKDGKAVGGKKEFIGMKVVNGKFEPSPQPHKYRGTYSRYNYRPHYRGTIRYQNKDGVPGVWYVRPDGTEREWDEPIE